MLTSAKQKHGEAVAIIGTPDANAIARLRKVLKLLEEVEPLAEDAGSCVENDAMVAALKELQQQQASIKLAIERLEKRRQPFAVGVPLASDCAVCVVSSRIRF